METLNSKTSFGIVIEYESSDINGMVTSLNNKGIVLKDNISNIYLSEVGLKLIEKIDRGNIIDSILD